MSEAVVTKLLLILLSLLGLAHALGSLSVRLRQPRVIGEILAGVVLSPAIVGPLPTSFGLRNSVMERPDALNFVSWLGLLLLMFLSGTEARNLLSRANRKSVAWLTIMGTGLPFVAALALGPWLVHPALLGSRGNHLSLIIVLLDSTSSRAGNPTSTASLAAS